MKINGPAGSDVLIPFGGPPDPSKGRCAPAKEVDDGHNPVRTGILGIFVVASLVLISFGHRLPPWPQGKTHEAYFTDAAGISPGSDVNVSGIKVGHVESVGPAGTAAKVRFTVDRKVPGGRAVAGGHRDRDRAR